MPDTQAVVEITMNQATVQVIEAEGVQVVEVLAATPGLGTSRAIVESRAVITENHTITTGWNGLSVGPVTIAEGVVVTIPENSQWRLI